jgi:hypothetical protein
MRMKCGGTLEPRAGFAGVEVRQLSLTWPLSSAGCAVRGDGARRACARAAVPAGAGAAGPRIDSLRGAGRK